MRKGFRLLTTITVLMIIAGCGGSGGPGGTASNKYYTIKYSVNDKDSKSSVAKNLQHTKEVSAPDDTTKPEVIPEKIGENRYFVNDPIAAGVMVQATTKEVFAFAGAMCQVYEVDKSSGNRVVIEDCTWSCEDPAVGQVTNSTKTVADFSFSVRGKTNVIAKTPDGVEVKIPAHVYPCTMLNSNTAQWGKFLEGFKFADETSTSDESAADIYIDKSNETITINGGLCKVDQPFAQITEAPTDASKYTFNTFNWSDIQPILFSSSTYILKTSDGEYIKFRFLGLASDYSVTIQYLVADSGTAKFQY